LAFHYRAHKKKLLLDPISNPLNPFHTPHPVSLRHILSSFCRRLLSLPGGILSSFFE